MAPTLRTLTGLVSVAVPVGFIVIAIVEPMFWPRGATTFDYLRGTLAIAGLSMVAGFVWYVLRTNAVPNEKRRLWVTVLTLGNIFALPFFWFWYVHKSGGSVAV